MRQFVLSYLLKRIGVFAVLPFFLVARIAVASPATPKYVQGNDAVPQKPQTTVAVTFKSAQTVGNLNAVIVGWNDSSHHISSVTDAKGNVYRLAAGPIVLSGAVSQAIYYAKDIFAAAAGTNTVTVVFTGAAIAPDIRILEYNGLDPVSPLDVDVGATGAGLSCSSGSVTTKNATDLLLGANTVQTWTTAPGYQFAERLLTDPDGDVAEDRSVTTIGAYSAGGTLLTPGGWVMQMVAFRAAGSTPAPTPNPTTTPTPKPTPTPTPKPTPTPTSKPTPTPTSKPTPTPTPTPTPKPSATPTSLTFAWNADAATSNPATNTVGYRLHVGVASGVYTKTTTLGNTTSATVSNLISGLTYYCVVTAYNSAGVESPRSKEVSYKVP
jgi:hypothetical protein